MEQLVLQNVSGWTPEHFRAYLEARSQAHTRRIIISWIVAQNMNEEDLTNCLSKFRVLKINELSIKREAIEIPVRAILQMEAGDIELQWNAGIHAEPVIYDD